VVRPFSLNVRLFGHTPQRSHAVAITARVDSAELAVESVRNIICRLARFGRRNEIFARDPGNNLANSIILQDNEIAIVIREAVFAIQATRIAGRQPPAHGRQIASLVRIIGRVAQVLFHCKLVRVLSHVVTDVKATFEILHHAERPAFRRYYSLNPPSHGPALGFHRAGVTFYRFRDCLRIARFGRACPDIVGTRPAGRRR